MNELPLLKRWCDVPQTLATLTMLRRIGLKPVGPPRALVRYQGHRITHLFAVAEAAPRRSPSAAQLEALHKARAAIEEKRAAAEAREAQERHERAIARRELRLQLAGERQVVAQQQLERWAGDPRVCVLDVETTDLDGPVIEVALVDGAGGLVFHSRVALDPGESIADDAHALHGISREDLEGAPTWREVAPVLLEHLAGKVVLSFNLDFDLGRLSATARRRGCCWEPGWADAGCIMQTISSATDFESWPDEVTWIGLSAACAQFSVTAAEPLHSATGDARRAAALVRAAAASPPAEVPPRALEPCAPGPLLQLGLELGAARLEVSGRPGGAL